MSVLPGLALAALSFFGLPTLAVAQVRTAGGDPLFTVTDPAKAVPVGKQSGRAPALQAGQTVHLLEETQGEAMVFIDGATPGGPLQEITYRLPRSALQPVPGNTRLDRPEWLPTPAPAATTVRDVVAYTETTGMFVLSGQDAPRHLGKGNAVWRNQPTMAPDGSFLVCTPARGIGLVRLSLDAADTPVRLPGCREPVGEKSFSPDGSRLAWRSGRRIAILDLGSPEATPHTVTKDLQPGGHLQGFTAEGTALVVLHGKTVTWMDLHGRTLRTVDGETLVDDGEGLGLGACIPSPVDKDLLLLVVATRGTPEYHRWANDVSGALFLYDAASGTTYRLTPRRLAVAQGAWSPDGRRLYFSALPDTPPNGRHHIYRINADGTDLTDLGPGFAPSVGTRP